MKEGSSPLSKGHLESESAGRQLRSAAGLCWFAPVGRIGYSASYSQFLTLAEGVGFKLCPFDQKLIDRSVGVAVKLG